MDDNIKCPTCGHSVYNPYRRTDNQGKITEGCIDKCHDQFLVKPSTSWAWVIDNRKKNKVYCKNSCSYNPKNKKDYHCQLCNLV